jgi:mRNA-degrading endonuclease toxin of MazEF toxin-antitoxin module
MKRGEIRVANLNPPRGRETDKVRPVLVAQADETSRRRSGRRGRPHAAHR